MGQGRRNGLDSPQRAPITSHDGWKGRRPMSVLPIRRSTAASTLAEALREQLLSGAFAPGTPLREADRRRAHGRDDRDRPRGAGGAGARRPRDPLAAPRRRGRADHRRRSCATSTRRGACTRRRAWRRCWRGDRSTSRWLRAACERMGEAAVAGDGRALVEADMAFHLAIVAAAGSRRLTRAAQGGLMELRLVLSVADRAADDLPALVADHQHLMDVFAAGVGAERGRRAGGPPGARRRPRPRRRVRALTFRPRLTRRPGRAASRSA